MDTCGFCFKETVLAGVCTSCGRIVTAELVINEETLRGFLHNARLAVRECAPGESFQVLGLLGPRPGRDAEDGIFFTEETCQLAHQVLVRGHVTCLRIDTVLPGEEVVRSLVVSPDQDGLTACVKRAEEIVKKLGGKVVVHASF